MSTSYPSVRDALSSLKAAATGDRKLGKLITETLPTSLALLDHPTVSQSACERLVKLLREPLVPLYANNLSATLQFASALAFHLLSTKFGAKDTPADTSSLAAWGSILHSLLGGVLDYMDQSQTETTKGQIAAAFFPGLCSVMRWDSDLRGRLPSTVQSTVYTLLSDAVVLCPANQKKLRDPKHLGPVALGKVIGVTKNLLVLENLFILFAHLLPSKTSPKRAAFVQSAFVTPQLLSKECASKISSIFEGEITQWEATLSKVIDAMAFSDLDFPQPFNIPEVRVCHQVFPQLGDGDRLHVDRDYFLFNVLVKEDLYESLQVRYSTITEIALSSSSDQMVRVTIIVNSPPLLGDLPVKTRQKGSKEVPIILVEVELERSNVQRFLAVLRKRGLAPILKAGKYAANSRVSITESSTCLDLDELSQRNHSIEKKIQDVESFYASDLPSIPDTTVNSTANTKRKDQTPLSARKGAKASTNTGTGKGLTPPRDIKVPVANTVAISKTAVESKKLEQTPQKPILAAEGDKPDDLQSNLPSLQTPDSLLPKRSKVVYQRLAAKIPETNGTQYKKSTASPGPTSKGAVVLVPGTRPKRAAAAVARGKLIVSDDGSSSEAEDFEVFEPRTKPSKSDTRVQSSKIADERRSKAGEGPVTTQLEKSSDPKSSTERKRALDDDRGILEGNKAKKPKLATQVDLKKAPSPSRPRGRPRQEKSGIVTANAQPASGSPSSTPPETAPPKRRPGRPRKQPSSEAPPPKPTDDLLATNLASLHPVVPEPNPTSTLTSNDRTVDLPPRPLAVLKADANPPVQPPTSTKKKIIPPSSDAHSPLPSKVPAAMPKRGLLSAMKPSGAKAKKKPTSEALDRTTESSRVLSSHTNLAQIQSPSVPVDAHNNNLVTGPSDSNLSKDEHHIAVFGDVEMPSPSKQSGPTLSRNYTPEPAEFTDDLKTTDKQAPQTGISLSRLRRTSTSDSNSVSTQVSKPQGLRSIVKTSSTSRLKAAVLEKSSESEPAVISPTPRATIAQKVFKSVSILTPPSFTKNKRDAVKAADRLSSTPRIYEALLDSPQTRDYATSCAVPDTSSLEDITDHSTNVMLDAHNLSPKRVEPKDTHSNRAGVQLGQETIGRIRSSLKLSAERGNSSRAPITSDPVTIDLTDDPDVPIFTNHRQLTNESGTLCDSVDSRRQVTPIQSREVLPMPVVTRPGPVRGFERSNERAQSTSGGVNYEHKIRSLRGFAAENRVSSNGTHLSPLASRSKVIKTQATNILGDNGIGEDCGEMDMSEIHAVLDDITKVIVENISKKVEVVRADARIARDKLLREATNDMRSMREEYVHHYHNLVELEKDFASASQRVLVSYKHAKNVNEETIRALRRIIHDHNKATTRNTSQALFPGPLPSAFRPYL